MDMGDRIHGRALAAAGMTFIAGAVLLSGCSSQPGSGDPSTTDVVQQLLDANSPSADDPSACERYAEVAAAQLDGSATATVQDVLSSPLADKELAQDQFWKQLDAQENVTLCKISFADDPKKREMVLAIDKDESSLWVISPNKQ